MYSFYSSKSLLLFPIHRKTFIYGISEQNANSFQKKCFQTKLMKSGFISILSELLYYSYYKSLAFHYFNSTRLLQVHQLFSQTCSFKMCKLNLWKKFKYLKTEKQIKSFPVYPELSHSFLSYCRIFSEQIQQ